jgi:hypothetical protein
MYYVREFERGILPPPQGIIPMPVSRIHYAVLLRSFQSREQRKRRGNEVGVPRIHCVFGAGFAMATDAGT